MKTLSIFATSTLLTLTLAIPCFAAASASQYQVAPNSIGFAQATDIAKKKAHGVIKYIDFDASDAEYEVEVLSNDTIYEIEIDANTRNIKDFDQATLDKHSIEDYEALLAAKYDINQAIEVSVHHIQGQVTSAEFEFDDNKSTYEVNVLRSGEIYELIIDATTGEVISNTLD